jgi:hypothetical protein
LICCFRSLFNPPSIDVYRLEVPNWVFLAPGVGRPERVDKGGLSLVAPATPRSQSRNDPGSCNVFNFTSRGASHWTTCSQQCFPTGLVTSHWMAGTIRHSLHYPKFICSRWPCLQLPTQREATCFFHQSNGTYHPKLDRGHRPHDQGPRRWVQHHEHA